MRTGRCKNAWYNKKGQGIVEDLENHRLRYALLAKKGKGYLSTQKYRILHSGGEENKRAQGGVNLLIDSKYKENTVDIKYIDEHMKQKECYTTSVCSEHHKE